MLAAAEADSSLHSFNVSGAIWIGFLVFVAVLLLVDLLVLHRDAHDISIREAGISSAIWIAIGIGFTGVVWALIGSDAATQYITGYAIEKSLSVDNVFVWAVIFGYFNVPNKYQHRVLFWGVFGALVLRAIFIFAGVALLDAFDWLLYVFGALLIITAIRVARHSDEEIHPDQNPVLRIVRRFVPVSSHYDGQRLFTLIEATDVVFAVDSVPAILAISRDQFVVFSSNAMAILGLRALYFLLAGAKDRLIYLNVGLGVILFYVGVKMLISNWYHIPTPISLAVIVVVLGITVWLSLRASAGQEPESTDGSSSASNKH
jgi:tellurite resistance protein TerC